MNIGILQCDRIHSSLRDSFGDYPSIIESCLGSAAKNVENNENFNPNLKFTTYQSFLSELPESVDSHDIYIVTGGRFAAFEKNAWISALKHFIFQLKKTEKKVIGIGFGHQLIAEALGGKVERADTGWMVGIHKMTVIENKAFMVPRLEYYHAVMNSEDFISILPECATILSQGCSYNDVPNYGLLSYGDNILTSQAHIDYSSKLANDMIRLQKENMPSKRFEKGILSLSENKNNGHIIFEWIYRFLTKVKESDTIDKEKLSQP